MTSKLMRSLIFSSSHSALLKAASAPYTFFKYPRFHSFLPSCLGNFSTLTTQKHNSLESTNQQDKHEIAHHEEVKGLYHTPVSHHGDPREHLFSDGTRRWEYTADTFHWDEYWANVPQQEFVVVDGQKMIKGVPTRPMDELYCTSQQNLPFWSRNRLNIWGNYPLILKAEFLFFWIPTAIIWSLAIPAFSMIYMMDEAINTTMTVKVIGRQWYWVYEVESPPEDDDE